MPLTKRADGKFVSPSGRVLTAAQVRAYYAKSNAKNKKKKRTKRKK